MNTAPSLTKAKTYLEQVDLGYISRKMCSVHYPLPRWQPELITQCETLYKRFLWLLIRYPEHPLIPTRDIDEFWHNYILYTKQYLIDCLALRGRYIHHHPSDPENAEETTKLSSQFTITKQLYRQEFGENLQVLVRS